MNAIHGVAVVLVFHSVCLSAQILRYDFDEGEGTSAWSSGQLQDRLTLKDKAGVPTTALWGNPGSGPSGLILDRALNLIGADGMGTMFSGPHAITDSPLGPADALDQFTITGWFRPFTQDLDRATLIVIRNGNTDLRIVGLSGGIEPGARNRLRLSINDDAGAALADVDAVGGFEPLWSTPNLWGFFAVSYDGRSESNKVVFYCGGVSTPAAVSVPSHPFFHPIAAIQFPLGNSIVCIGSGLANSDPFRGYMDDIRVYGTALVLSEVENVRLSGVPGPSLVDFRNFIPGVVDAPVYSADGTYRLSGRMYWAQLYAGPDADSLQPWGAPLFFQEGEMAGYWDNCCDPSVYLRNVPWAPGQQIAVQARAWEMGSEGWNEVMPPPRLWGASPVFYLTLLDTPTPLVGLESFSLRAAPIREIRAEGDQVVLRWSAGNGRAHYALETSAGLKEPMVWTQVPTQAALVENYESEWVVTNRVTAPAAYYRIRLLDP